MTMTIAGLRNEANAAAAAYSQAVLAAEKALEEYRKAHNAVLVEQARLLLKDVSLSEHERRVHEAFR